MFSEPLNALCILLYLVPSPVSNIYGLAADRVVSILYATFTSDISLIFSCNSKSSLLLVNISSPTTVRIPIFSSPFGAEVVAHLA